MKDDVVYAKEELRPAASQLLEKSKTVIEKVIADAGEDVDPSLIDLQHQMVAWLESYRSNLGEESEGCAGIFSRTGGLK